MMKNMIGGRTGEGFDPMEMCRQMMQGMTQASSLATYATPEVRALFEDWVKEVEDNVLAYIRERPTSDPAGIAAHLNIAESTAIFFIGKLAREGKVKIGTVATA